MVIERSRKGLRKHPHNFDFRRIARLRANHDNPGDVAKTLIALWGVTRVNRAKTGEVFTVENPRTCLLGFP